jgi:hypothetical protein
MQATAGAVGGGTAEATDSPTAGLLAALMVAAGAAGANRFLGPARNRLEPETARLAGVAQQEGIPLTPGQTTGSSPLRTLESTFEQLPFTAGPAADVRRTQQVAFNRAVMQRAGIAEDHATPDILHATQQRIGGQIGAISGRTTAQFDPALQQQITALAQDATRNADDQVGRQIVNRVADLTARIGANGQAPGEMLRELDTAIGLQARGSQNPDLARRLNELQDIIRDGVAAGATPADAAALTKARRHYANLVNVQNAMAGSGEAAAAGNIPPNMLRNALTQSVGRRNYANGEGDMNDLVRVGQAFMRAPPDSGTPRRMMMQSLLTGGAGVAGGLPGLAAALVGPRLAQMAYENPRMQQFLINGIGPNPLPVSRGATGAIAGAQIPSLAQSLTQALLAR